MQTVAICNVFPASTSVLYFKYISTVFSMYFFTMHCKGVQTQGWPTVFQMRLRMGMSIYDGNHALENTAKHKN